MRQHHQLKLKDEYWEEVFSGRKTFEIRNNDRKFKVNDTVSFVRIRANETVVPEGCFKIRYIYSGDLIPEGYVVFSIVPFTEKEEGC